ENFNDVLVEASPYVVITRALKLKGTLSWRKGHEDRMAESGLNTSAAEDPAQWQRHIARLEAVYKRGRVGFMPFGEFTQIRLDNVARIGGGQSFINDDRDRDQTDLGVEISCDITDRSTLYWRSFWFDKNYKRNDFDTGAGTYTGDNRDSNGLQSVLGVRLPLTNLIALDLQAGYHHQRYDDPTFDAIGTVIGEADLNWAITPLTTVTFSAARAVYDTAQDGATAYIAHTGHATISHELRRNLMADAGFYIGHHAYKDFDRNDDLTGGGAGATWMMNRHMHWRATYIYEDRDSNITANRYDKHRIFVSLKVPF